MNDDLENQLAAVDWDFSRGWTQCGLHRIHWYPGSYIPQIAGTLIQLLSQVDGIVLDPFCGSGTTLLEAVRLGRRPVGLDSSRLGVLISNVKCRCGLVPAAQLSRELTLILNEAFRRSFAPEDPGPGRARLSRWFCPETLNELQSIWSSIESQTSAYSTHFFQVCLSHILRSTCSQRNHWGWIADNVAPKALTYYDATTAFRRHVEQMLKEYEAFQHNVGSGEPPLLPGPAMLHDCRVPLGVGKVDAIVTSPPYPCVVDYTRAHRLSYEFFGWEMEREEAVEIGGRWKRFRRGQMHEYMEDMAAAFATIDSMLKPGGLIGLVVDGTKRKHRGTADARLMDFSHFLQERFDYFPVGETILRQLSSQRLLDRRGNINVEQVIVMRKP